MEVPAGATVDIFSSGQESHPEGAAPQVEAQTGENGAGGARQPSTGEDQPRVGGISTM